MCNATRDNKERHTNQTIPLEDRTAGLRKPTVGIREETVESRVTPNQRWKRCQAEETSQPGDVDAGLPTAYRPPAYLRVRVREEASQPGDIDVGLPTVCRPPEY